MHWMNKKRTKKFGLTQDLAGMDKIVHKKKVNILLWQNEERQNSQIKNRLEFEKNVTVVRPLDKWHRNKSATCPHLFNAIMMMMMTMTMMMLMITMKTLFFVLFQDLSLCTSTCSITSNLTMIKPNCILVNGPDCEMCSCLYFPGAAEDNH
jgi:cellulose synthase/poly-beta-1,6-N-acetylglucosamine synthase-like glycosyltransferase